MGFNQLQELPHLVGFCQTIFFRLYIHNVLDFRMLIQVMRTSYPNQRKPEGFHERTKILKTDIILVVLGARVQLFFFAHTVIMPQKGPAMPEEMVIFSRTFDLLTWLLPHCEKFPKAQRYLVVQRLGDAALDFQGALFHANTQRGEQRLLHLRAADGDLTTLRLYLRLAYQWEWLSVGQYEHVSKMVEEIGRLLGGWIRQSQGTDASNSL